MDLAGLAALLAIPAGLIVAVSGILRERSLFKRWQRTETMLAEGTLHGRERTMVENARDHLAERIAAGELQPRYTMLLIGALFAAAFGVVLVEGEVFFPTWEDTPGHAAWTVLGWIMYGIGVVGFFGRLMLRTHWVSTNQSENFRRSNTII